MNEKCMWHITEDEVESIPECPCGCSHYLETKKCEGCGGTFLDWEADDDCQAYVLSPKRASNGEIVCSACLPAYEEEIEESEFCDMFTDDSFEDLLEDFYDEDCD